jgi:hypothetical protein
MAELRQKLDKRPEFREFMELVQFVQTARRLMSGAESAQKPPQERPLSSRRARTKEAETMINTVQDILEESGTPMKTSEILHTLLERGIKVPGKDPRNNLSARLSYNKDKFESRGSEGWTVVRRRAPDPPNGVFQFRKSGGGQP